MRLLLDLNVVLDVVLDRQPFVSDALGVSKACADGRATGHVSAISLPTLFYIVRKAKGNDASHEAVRLCMESFEICEVGRGELNLARTLSGNDFEDNVQIACAIRSGLEIIITRNPSDFKHSPLKVMTAGEWILNFAS